MPLGGDQIGAVARVRVAGERGTGFLITPDGLVLTALHCVARAASFSTQTIDWIPGTIKLRFGDPTLPGAHDTTGSVVAYAAAKDLVLLKCKDLPPATPLPLGRIPTGVDQWESYGFPNFSGALPGSNDPVEVAGQACSGAIQRLGPRLQLSLATVPLVDGQSLAGISGAPILVAGAVVGMALQEPRQGESIAQNALYASALEEALRTPLTPFTPGEPVPELPWQAVPPVGLDALVAKLQNLPELGLLATALKASDAEASRVGAQLLSCAVKDVINAIEGHASSLKGKFKRVAQLPLLLCSARLPAYATTAADKTLASDGRAAAPLWVGAREATSKSLAFRFMLVKHGLDFADTMVVVVGVLPGAEDVEAELKEAFRQELATQLGVDGKALDKKLANWLALNRVIIAIAEMGYPENLTEVLRSVYPLVNVMVRGAPPLSIATGNVVERCVPEELEDDFELMLEELGS